MLALLCFVLAAVAAATPADNEKSRSRAQRALRSGDFERAEQIYRELLAKDDRDTDALVGLLGGAAVCGGGKSERGGGEEGAAGRSHGSSGKERLRGAGHGNLGDGHAEAACGFARGGLSFTMVAEVPHVI